MAEEPQDPNKGIIEEEEPKTPEPPKVPEETPAETGTETPSVTPEEEPAAEVSPEEIASTVKSEFTKKILDAIGMTPKEAEDQELVPVWEKENRNPRSYKEIGEWASVLTERKLADKETAKAKEQEEADNVSKQYATEYNKNLNTYWDEQLAEMEVSGLIPRRSAETVKRLQELPNLTKEEREDEIKRLYAADAGYKARTDLFATMQQSYKERTAEGKSPILSLKEIYYESVKENKTTQPAGWDAPVSGGEKAVDTGSNNEIDYAKDIRGKSLFQIMAEAAS